MSAANPALVEVEVAYATAEVQSVATVEVVAGAPVRDVLRLSGLCDHFPEIDISICPVGVFGTPVDDSYRVKPGDRVEVYRPLERDPRDARRELAARGLTVGSKSGVS